MGNHKEAMASFWREALRTYRQGCWIVHREALGRLGRGWLSIGEPIDAAFCAVLSEDEKLAESVAEDVLSRRQPETVRSVVDRLISIANLRDHFCVACTIVSKLSDAIPDDQVERVVGWLLDRCGLEGSPNGARGPLYRAWQTLEHLAPRVTMALARRSLEIATRHPAWRESQSGRISIPREKIVETVNLLVPALPVTDMDDLARQTLPLAIERRQDHDYGEVLNLLSHISYRGGDGVKSFIGSRLFASGRALDYLLIQFAPTYGKAVLEGESLGELSSKVARNVRLQVQRRPVGQSFDEVNGAIMRSNQEEGGQSIQVTFVNLADWHAMVRHRRRLDVPALRAMVDSAIEMLADPKNELSNRAGLIQGLMKLCDVFDEVMTATVIMALEPIARGEIHDPNRHENHPLGSFQWNTTTPDTLRGAAIFGLARVAAREPDRYRVRVEEQIEEAMGSASVEIRRGAITAFRDFPCRSENLLLWALLATRDPDSAAATSAFAAIGGKENLTLNRNHWRLFLASIQMASLSKHVDLRRHASAALARLWESAPSGSIRDDVMRLLQVFSEDDCASVRVASRRNAEGGERGQRRGKQEMGSF
ncbi:MAG: hypothetical protein JWN86_3386 [Planctomycetota bacterium]|nr:hypothetical protein [Planctomycetota bacterium]